MLCIISKKPIGDTGQRYIHNGAGISYNPYPERYAVVPQSMVNDIFETRGFCDIELDEEGSTVVSFTANEIPEIEEPPVSEEVSIEAVLNTLLGVN